MRNRGQHSNGSWVIGCDLPSTHCVLGPASSWNRPTADRNPCYKQDVVEVTRAVPLKGHGGGSNSFWSPLWSQQGCFPLPPAQLCKEATSSANCPLRSQEGQETGKNTWGTAAPLPEDRQAFTRH